MCECDQEYIDEMANEAERAGRLDDILHAAVTWFDNVGPHRSLPTWYVNARRELEMPVTP